MTPWLRMINALLYLAASTLVATGLALEWKIEIEDEGRTLLGMNGEMWGEIHFIVALVVVGLAIIHLAMHWLWIKNLLNRLPWPTIACLVAGLVLIAVVLATPVSGSGGDRHAAQSHDSD